MKRSQTALAGLVALLGLILVVAAKAQAPAAKAPTTLKADVSRGSKQKQDVVEAIFKARRAGGAQSFAGGQEGRTARRGRLPGGGAWRSTAIWSGESRRSSRPTTTSSSCPPAN